MDESVVKQFEQQQIGKLKLSQAIRIGAKLRPQARCVYFTDGRSCAIGAAYEATTGRYETDMVKLSADVGAWMRQYPHIGLSTFQAITHKNDSGQSREAIADWLEAQGL